MSINLKIKSIGWCLNDSAGGSPGDVFAISAKNKPEKSDIFLKPFKNFGRLDGMSKAVCTAAAFALRGAELYPREEKQPISIYFSNKEGSQESDTAYFKDFVDFGETAGRANLFLYTLPSSPLGEASVHFGLTGDVAYSADSENPLKAMLEAAEDACAFRKSDSEKLFLIGLGGFSSLRSPIVNSSRIGRSANSKNHPRLSQSSLNENKLRDNKDLLRSENANYLEKKTEAIFLLISDSSPGIVNSEEILKSYPDFETLKKMLLCIDPVRCTAFRRVSKKL